MNTVPARRGPNTRRQRSTPVLLCLVCVAAFGGENEAVQFRPMELSFTAQAEGCWPGWTDWQYLRSKGTR